MNLEDGPPVPGGVTAIREGKYITESRTPGHLATKTIQEQLERWIIEMPLPDGHYEKVSLWQMVLDSQRAAIDAALATAAAAVEKLDWSETGWGDDVTLASVLRILKETPE